jgi:hypothetical protein
LESSKLPTEERKKMAARKRQTKAKVENKTAKSSVGRKAKQQKKGGASRASADTAGLWKCKFSLVPNHLSFWSWLFCVPGSVWLAAVFCFHPVLLSTHDGVVFSSPRDASCRIWLVFEPCLAVFFLGPRLFSFPTI